MARGAKWLMNFASKDGVQYRLAIFADGYSGGTTQLTPATEPFYVEEDYDEDLLQVVRAKTGYIRFIRYDDTDVDDLIPTTVTDRYIELYRNNLTIFKGYLQPQSYEKTVNYADSGNPGEEMEIAFTSPLGIINDLEFDKETTPQTFTLAAVLNKALGKMGGSEGSPYQYVYFPRASNSDRMLFTTTISSLLISPLSEDNVHGYSLTLSDCFDQQTVGYFIEGLAHAYGCIVHEVANALVFSRFDFDDQFQKYERYAVGTSGCITINNPGAVALSPSYLIAVDNVASTMRPLRKLEINYEGDFNVEHNMSFQHCQRRTGNDAYQKYGLATNIPVLTAEVNVPYVRDSCSVSATNGRPIYTGGYLIAYGNGSLSEMALFCFNSEQTGHTYNNGDVLLECGFFGYIGKTAKLSIEVKWGENMKLENPDLPDLTPPAAYVRVEANGKYLSSDGTWVASVTNAAQINLQKLKENGDQLFTLDVPSYGITEQVFPLKVSIVQSTLGLYHTNYLVAFSDVSLSYSATSNVTDYVYEGSNSNPQVLKGDGLEEDSIDVPFSPYFLNSHSLYPQIGYNIPDYRYMFKPQRIIRITISGVMPTDPEYLLYLQKTMFKGTPYRITAISYDPWNDERTLTMHNSETLNE